CQADARERHGRRRRPGSGSRASTGLALPHLGGRDLPNASEVDSAVAGVPRDAVRRGGRGPPSVQREDDEVISARRIELVIAARGYGHVLDTARHVRDRAPVDAGAGPELPEELAGFGVEGVEGAGGLADEDEVAGGDEDAAARGRRELALPADLARPGVDRGEDTGLGLLGYVEEPAAEPEPAVFPGLEGPRVDHGLVERGHVDEARARRERG